MVEGVKEFGAKLSDVVSLMLVFLVTERSNY